jgi:hypothetical protein
VICIQGAQLGAIVDQMFVGCVNAMMELQHLGLSHGLTSQAPAIHN